MCPPTGYTPPECEVVSQARKMIFEATSTFTLDDYAAKLRDLQNYVQDRKTKLKTKDS